MMNRFAATLLLVSLALVTVGYLVTRYTSTAVVSLQYIMCFIMVVSIGANSYCTQNYFFILRHMTIATSTTSLARKNVSLRMHGSYIIIDTMVKMTIMIAMTIMIPAIFVELGTVMILCSTSTRIKFVMTHMDKMATRILIILKLIM